MSPSVQFLPLPGKACSLCFPAPNIKPVVDPQEIPAEVRTIVPVEHEIPVGYVPVTQSPVAPQQIPEMKCEIPVCTIDGGFVRHVGYPKRERQATIPAVVTGAIEFIMILPAPAACKVNQMLCLRPVIQKQRMRSRSVYDVASRAYRYHRCRCACQQQHRDKTDGPGCLCRRESTARRCCGRTCPVRRIQRKRCAGFPAAAYVPVNNPNWHQIEPPNRSALPAFCAGEPEVIMGHSPTGRDQGPTTKQNGDAVPG